MRSSRLSLSRVYLIQKSTGTRICLRFLDSLAVNVTTQSSRVTPGRWSTPPVSSTSTRVFSTLRPAQSSLLRLFLAPWWALILLCASKRIHSIFVLRLFNDCVAVTLAHAAIALFQRRRWYSGMIFFSLAVSVKMNILLYAPALLLLLCKSLTLGGVLLALAVAAAVQLLLGLPFLTSFPVAYMSNAFNLGRVFIHFWSVNFKFVPEWLFISKPFALVLMIVHLVTLFMFARRKWCKHEGGLLEASGVKNWKWTDLWSFAERQALRPEHVVGVLFTANFIGVIAARSLHYQFYSWYFYSLPFLLWRTPFPTPLRLLLFIVIEAVWNVYPSSETSSLLLLACHLTILWGLWRCASEYPRINKEKV